MTLIERIRKDQLQARKDKSPNAALLTTLLGEASMVGKSAGNRESTDEEVTAVVKKFIKNARETLNALASQPGAPLMPYENEILVLESYLPEQLSKDQLIVIIAEQFEKGLVEKGPKSKGLLMKYLKDNFAGQYDGKDAAAAIDEALKTQGV